MAHTALCYGQFEFDNYYEIDRLVEACVIGEHKRIALQFPDYLLSDSPEVCFRLQKKLNEKYESSTADKKPVVFVLGDTLFGSCCVDLIACQHYGADSLVHFGNACFTPCNRVNIPVYFVLDKCAVMDEGIEAALKKCRRFDIATPLIIAYDPGFHYKAYDAIKAIYNECPDRPLYVLEPEVAVIPLEDDEEKVFEKMTLEGTLEKGKLCRRLIKKVSPDCVLTPVDELPTDCDNMNCLLFGSAGKEENGYKFFESLILRLMIRVSNWAAIDLCSGEEIPLNVFKIASKRSYGIETIKKAESVGIVCCTPGLACAPLVQRVLARILRREGIITHSIVMSKMTAGKLENFIDVEVFVQLGCPEHPMLPLSETRRPVVLPTDVIHGFECREWDGGAITDLPELLQIGSQFLMQKAKEDAEEKAATEKKQTEEATPAGVTTLATILSNERSIVVGRTLEERLIDVKTRSYSGVEFGVPTDAPQDFKIRKGKVGIANHYDSDDRVKAGLPAENPDEIWTRDAKNHIE